MMGFMTDTAHPATNGAAVRRASHELPTGKRAGGVSPRGSELSPEVREWVDALGPLFTAAGMSRTQFAKTYNFDKSAVSRYLRGLRVPTTEHFLERLLQLAEDNGEPVGPQERERLIALQWAALRVATPAEYRVRIVNDKLQVALDSQQEAEHRAVELARQLDGCLQQLTELKVARDADRADHQAEKERLSTEIARLERELGDARRYASAAAAWVGVARTGLELCAAFFEGDFRTVERLLDEYPGEEISRLVERFVVAGIVTVEVLSMDGRRMPYDQALMSVIPHEEIQLFPGLPVGPWAEVLALAKAYRSGGDAAARKVPLTMDVPGAINTSFRFAVSALLALTAAPHFPPNSPGETARILIEGLDVGYAAA